MNTPGLSIKPLGWKKSFLCLVLAVACFNLAYASVKYTFAALFIFGYALWLIQLANQPTVRRAFYFGLAVGFGCAAGQGFFFFHIFGPTAIVLWIVYGFWIGLFTAISCGCMRRWGQKKLVWLIPVIWTGCEYFRSELYYLRFSWLNIGYVFSNIPHFPFHAFGMYGAGFLIVLIAAIFTYPNAAMKMWGRFLVFVLVLLFLLAWYSPTKRLTPLKIAGIQMEFPPENIIPEVLNQALKKNPDVPIFVMSEYTLDHGVTEPLKDWCRKNSRYLVIGGKDIVTNDVYYDTVFVVDTNGEIVFKQAKCVPIQLFKDGLPAKKQEVWDSPWGKIGFCICYDLSYTRITDELVRQGAQLLIVPSMDVEEWGKQEHILHSRVAPVRAVEYDIPIFRVASSGISQAVQPGGEVVAQTGIPERGAIFSARMQLPPGTIRPVDRYLAPFCVVITGVVTALLLFLTWKDKRPNLNQTKS